MKSHIEHMPAEAIVYMRRTGAYGPENYALMQSVKDWIHEQRLWKEGGTIPGTMSQSRRRRRAAMMCTS